MYEQPQALIEQEPKEVRPLEIIEFFSTVAPMIPPAWAEEFSNQLAQYAPFPALPDFPDAIPVETDNPKRVYGLFSKLLKEFSNYEDIYQPIAQLKNYIAKAESDPRATVNLKWMREDLQRRIAEEKVLSHAIGMNVAHILSELNASKEYIEAMPAENFQAKTDAQEREEYKQSLNMAYPEGVTRAALEKAYDERNKKSDAGIIHNAPTRDQESSEEMRLAA